MKELERALPAELGLSPLYLEQYLEDLSRHGAHSVTVLRHGRVALEAWWAPYQAEYEHIAYSLSKSFVSVAVGFACQEGLLSLDDRVIDFFPDRFSNRPCENMRNVTVRNLMNMCYGHRGITDHDFYRSADWLDEILHLYLENVPGENFFYDNRCTYLCSVILTRLTGMTVYDYLKPRLFDPLGMEGLWWETTKDGVNPGGWGLNIRTGDIAKFGQFLLNRGCWDGRQLLDAAFLDMAGDRLVENAGISVYDWADWNQGYGFWFWQCVPHRVYRGDGAFGQFVIVAPEQDMVLAVTAGTNRACDLLEDSWRMLAKAVDCTEGSQERLDARVAALRIPPAQGQPLCPDSLRPLAEKTYVFPKNEADFRSVTVCPGEDGDSVCLVTGTGVFQVQAGHGNWIENDTGYEKDAFNAMTSFLYSDAACSSAWSEDHMLLKLAFTRTPYVDSMTLRFLGDMVWLEVACDPVLPLRHDRFTLVGCAKDKLEK